MKTQEAGSQGSHWNLHGLVTWGKSLPLPSLSFPFCVMDIGHCPRIPPTLPAVSELCCLNQGTVSVSVSVPELAAENEEEVETHPPTCSPPYWS